MGRVGDLVAIFAEVDLADPERACSRIEAGAPFAGPEVGRIHELLLAGLEAGWLLDKERAGIRFGRLSSDLGGYSVDVVLSSGPGPRHEHPQGEIDLIWARAGTPTFDDHSEGWAVYSPGSIHVPEVKAGEMLILYFLPGGRITFSSSD